jgi:hypothetical protein
MSHSCSRNNWLPLTMHRQELESLFDLQLQKIIDCVKDALTVFESEGYKSVVSISIRK